MITYQCKVHGSLNRAERETVSYCTQCFTNWAKDHFPVQTIRSDVVASHQLDFDDFIKEKVGT